MELAVLPQPLILNAICPNVLALSVKLAVLNLADIGIAIPSVSIYLSIGRPTPNPDHK
jgi:hypothetical protein